ncbi:MAG: alpha-galactosidase, partial [Clostridia bacterium]|nr:alpha-galactosidase [Clostridia bacterium]
MAEHTETYRNVYYQPGESPVFCYRTGLTVYEETLYRGVIVSSGWNTAGYPLNVLTNCPTRLDPHAFHEPAVFSAVLDGRALEYGLTFADFKTEELAGRTKATLTLRSETLPVNVKIITELDGTPMFTRRLEIENQGDKPLCLSKLVLFGGGTEQMDRAPLTRENDVSKLYSLGYFEGDTWGYEGAFGWHDLTPGVFSVDTRFGADRYRHPLIFIKNNITGVIWFSQIAYSGGCRFSVGLHADPEHGESALSFGAGITGYAPLTVIGAGETFVSPAVHVGAAAGDLDSAVNAMHAHIRTSVLNAQEADASACLVGAGMGAEHDMSVETTKAFMRQFKEMGAEVFIIDAGWVCPPTDGSIDWGGYNGINVPDPDRYPNGISELSDDCH